MRMSRNRRHTRLSKLGLGAILWHGHLESRRIPTSLMSCGLGTIPPLSHPKSAADDASSRPGRAPESTCSSTYREAEADMEALEAHLGPLWEESEGAEGWVPHKCLDLDWPGQGPRASRCGRHSYPMSPGREHDSGSSTTRNPLGTSDLGRNTQRRPSRQASNRRSPGRYLHPDRSDPNRQTPTQPLQTPLAS